MAGTFYNEMGWSGGMRGKKERAYHRDSRGAAEFTEKRRLRIRRREAEALDRKSPPCAQTAKGGAPSESRRWLVPTSYVAGRACHDPSTACRKRRGTPVGMTSKPDEWQRNRVESR